VLLHEIEEHGRTLLLLLVALLNLSDDDLPPGTVTQIHIAVLASIGALLQIVIVVTLKYLGGVGDAIDELDGGLIQ
jgi:hypothetical protein